MIGIFFCLLILGLAIKIKILKSFTKPIDNDVDL